MSNLTVRVLVAVVAGPLILAACYFGGIYFFLFTTALIVVSISEFYSMARTKGTEPASVLGITSAGIINAIVYSRGINIAFYFLVAVLVIVLLSELVKKRTAAVSGAFANVGATIIGIVYIGLFGALLTAVRQRDGLEKIFRDYRDAGLFMIAILATIWICDSAAFFVGRSLGKHKMSRFVSPNKTWEGAIAGFAFAVATALGARFAALPHLDIRIALAMGFIVGTLGQAGDFVESLFKRDAGMKDSSHIIPGHGGIFDRFDSLLFAAPAIYLMLMYFR